MKKLIIGLLTAATLITIAPAAHADADDRFAIRSILTLIWTEELTYSDRDNICDGWNIGLRNVVYRELIPTIVDAGFTRYDAKTALRQFFNKAC